MVDDSIYTEYIKGLPDEEAHKHFAEQLIAGSKCFSKIEGMIRTMDINMKDLINRIKHIEEQFTDEASYERHKKNVERHREEFRDDILKYSRLIDAVKNIALSVMAIALVIYSFIK